MRQQGQQQLLSDLSGIPAYLAAARGPRIDTGLEIPQALPQGSFTPNMQAPLSQQLQPNLVLAEPPAYLTQ